MSDDYTVQIVNHFLHVRQRGAAISAVDQQLIMRWEAAELPLHVVLGGIDDAFTRLVDPPRSLVRCARFVSQRLKKDPGR